MNEEEKKTCIENTRKNYSVQECNKKYQLPEESTKEYIFVPECTRPGIQDE